jgi:hypothetical protein
MMDIIIAEHNIYINHIVYVRKISIRQQKLTIGQNNTKLGQHEK